MSHSHLSLLFISYLLLPGVISRTLTITNKCGYTIWPGILSNAGVPTLSPTGFSLHPAESKTITAPTSWAGRIWARTHCSASSNFTCVTGDCGSGTLECYGKGAVPPATLAEFKLDGYNGQDFYDVSLVDGYNLPILVNPQGGSGQNCSVTGCSVDLNGACPSELKVANYEGESVACKSACEAFRQPEYCCSGVYDSPSACKPSEYSEIFKSACPHAYSYAYDDGSSTFTCSSSPNYLITFCPFSGTSQKASQGQNADNPSSSPSSYMGSSLFDNSSMVYEGEVDLNGALTPTCTHVLGLISVLGTIWYVSQSTFF